VMVRNLPCCASTDWQQVLFDKFAELGFTNDMMDYVYLPMRENMQKVRLAGYMFVNFNTAELAASFCEVINSCNMSPRALSGASMMVSKVVLCSLADTQGVDANVDQFLRSGGFGFRNPVWVRHGAAWSPLFRA